MKEYKFLDLYVSAVKLNDLFSGRTDKMIDNISFLTSSANFVVCLESVCTDLFLIFM